MRFKKGEVLPNEIIGVILAAVVVFVLVYFMAGLFASDFYKGEEVAESYFGMLEEAVRVADSGKVGEFFILDDGDEKLDFYLVYFGEVPSYYYDEFEDISEELTSLGKGRTFVALKKKINNICICYWQKKSICNYCMGLDLPADYSGKDVWAIGEGSRIQIEKDEVNYDFARA